ncbi:double zinc ribbon domain-containing protein [Methanobrevibacter sp.]
MNKKCPKCDTDNDVSAEYCLKCGYHFQDDNSHYKPIQFKALKCPQCHHTIENLSYGFCTRCGFEFQKQENNVTYNFLEVIPQLEYEKTIKAGYFLAILIPIVGLFIGIYNFTRKNSPSARHAGVIQICLSLAFLMMDILYISIILNANI